uniref:Uncharacterized protein n=1 Tax=Populus trichocarpa TaxID=3694 RepID=A0A3N7FX42_POPTR
MLNPNHQTLLSSLPGLMNTFQVLAADRNPPTTFVPQQATTTCQSRIALSCSISINSSPTFARSPPANHSFLLG